ncbi:MAG: UDP-N-acetylmuramate dehydrogenase [Flavobacteriales bacterium]|nr:UDP-N-acetylmuramate dehydrogenase [Flavobacteriales bacterium]
MNVIKNYSLHKLNTFGIDVNAKLYCEINSTDELIEIIGSDDFKNNQVLILGGGSNLLFTKDYNGIVVKNNLKGIEVVEENNDHVSVTVGGGENWHEFVMHCVNNNYGGIENLSLIPGNVGASPMQNIGAYGVEVKDTITKVEAIDLSDGAIKVFSNADCNFGYRTSVFKQELKNKYLISAVTFQLTKQPTFNTSYGAITSELEAMGVTDLSIKNISKAVCNIRSSKLPDVKVTGNAGSFFKNPVIDSSTFEKLKSDYPEVANYPQPNGKVKLAAGWMIEQCGWKGKRIKDYGVHPQHALVLVNYGVSNGQDIYNLSGEIIASVEEKFSVTLEREVNIL